MAAFPAGIADQHSAKTGAHRPLHEKTLRTHFFEFSCSWFSLFGIKGFEN
jgi:hypothetical protein